MPLTMLRALLGASLLGLLLGLSPAMAEDVGKFTAEAQLQDTDGNEVGKVSLHETPNGALFDISLKGLPEGTHAFHIHETGKCEPPFKSAGGHFNPTGAKHGLLQEDGPHAGDFPNIHVPEGELRVEYLNQRVTLLKGKDGSLLDDDGSAIVIHEGGDDYKTDPAGEAGNRIACGVIEG